MEMRSLYTLYQVLHNFLKTTVGVHVYTIYSPLYSRDLKKNREKNWKKLPSRVIRLVNRNTPPAAGCTYIHNVYAIRFVLQPFVLFLRYAKRFLLQKISHIYLRFFPVVIHIFQWAFSFTILKRRILSCT